MLFRYKAKTLQGETITGKEELKNEKELAQFLLEKNYILISATPEKEIKKITPKVFHKLPFKKSVPLIEKIMFTRHLGVMIEAGLSFNKSLSILAEQTKNKTFKEIILNTEEKILKGESFSAAISEYKDVFSELYINMIRIGEETGNFKKVLDILANQLERDHELISKVKGAMVYPGVILGVMIIVGILMMITVIPQFSQLFQELKIDLPFMTKILLGISNLLVHRFYLFVLFVLALIFGIKRFKKTKNGKKLFCWLFLKIPLFGPLNIKINTTRSARILSSLVKSGVPIVTAIKILSRTLSNIYYKKALKKITKEVQKGKTLKEAFSPYSTLFSFLLFQMIGVGEKTGKLSEILEKLADFYESEIDKSLKNISSIIEPLLMVVIGIIVGFFVVSMVQPMYSIMKGI